MSMMEARKSLKYITRFAQVVCKVNNFLKNYVENMRVLQIICDDIIFHNCSLRGGI